MTVHFIGAGPGAPDLLTLRGRDLIAACPVCLYAGSLIPEALLEHCPEGAHIINTAPLDLDAIIRECRHAEDAGLDVARLHSGDLSIWSAMGEQLRRLRGEGIAVTVTPGVPSFAAAAAALGTELTLPGLAQSVVLTRTPGRASAMPQGETLRNFAATGATLAIHLSIHNLEAVLTDLQPTYGSDCPVAVVYRASWPDQQIIRATLGTLKAAMQSDIERTALILVGPALAADRFDESCLYAPDYDRRFRPQSAQEDPHEYPPRTDDLCP
jgi:precorrin-4/cobalt-precorrin-4 C11-methyltransferase